MPKGWITLFMLGAFILLIGCDSGSDSDVPVDGDGSEDSESADIVTDGDDASDGDAAVDGDADAEIDVIIDGDTDGDVDGDADGDEETEAETDAVRAVAVESVQELGALPFMDVILARDGGFSTSWQGRSVWTFGDTIMSQAGEDGTAWRSSTWTQTEDSDASDGIGPFSEPTDALGVPYEFLPFTPDEQAFNDAHRGDDCTAGDDCGARYALWPGPIVALPDGTALIFYTKLIARPGAFNFSALGSSVATWAAPDQPVVRPQIRPEASDPTLLFQSDEPNFNASAILHDGYIYAYAALEEWMAQPCIVGRVAVDQALERSAWRFYTPDGEWSEDFSEAEPVIEGSTIMSIHYSDYFNRYVAIHNAIVSNDVVLHTAEQPEGPWSAPVMLFTGLAPDITDSWNYSGLGHAEFAQEGGKVEYITYYRPGDWSGEMRLVKVVFE